MSAWRLPQILRAVQVPCFGGSVHSAAVRTVVTASNNPFSSRISPGAASASLIQYQQRRAAGHSKWANIRHTKAANDQARAKDVVKFLNLIHVAVKEHGSPDPKLNSKLAQILAQIKDAKLSSAPFDRALQALQTKKDNQYCMYPIRGSGHSMMLIDLESPNISKSKQQINIILKKNRGLAMDDSVLYLFDHKGILLSSEVDGKPASDELLDAATEHAIEAGASDVSFLKADSEFGNVFEFTTEPSAFFKVKTALEALKYNLVHAELLYVPKTPVELPEEDLEHANKLYTKLVEHPDVNRVYVNFV